MVFLPTMPSPFVLPARRASPERNVDASAIGFAMISGGVPLGMLMPNHALAS